MSDLFFVFGLSLCALALVVAFIGIKKHDFPRSTPALLGGLAFFAALVALTCSFAVVLAREEQEHREHERAEQEAEVSEEEPVGEGASEEAQPEEGGAEAEGGTAGGGAGGTVELSSPEDGSLVFEPDSLEAAAGEVTIEYTNPSQVPHDVAIEADGETVANGDVVSNGDVSVATAELEPGEYVFYCSVPGHREGGMEGRLTVK